MEGTQDSRGFRHQVPSAVTPRGNAGAPALPNPPSIEAAYKRKCIELKKRLSEVEATNDDLRLRNMRGVRYIEKMRLESCILLDRLALLMRMTGETAPSKNLPQGSEAKETTTSGARSGKRVLNEMEFLDAATDGSSEGHPPTPEERPMRAKRRRPDEQPPAQQPPEPLSCNAPNSTLPPLLPAIHSSGSSNPPTAQLPQYLSGPALPQLGSPQPLQTSAPHPQPTSPHRHQHYLTPYEDFCNRHRAQVTSAMLEAYGSASIRDTDIEHELEKHWDKLDPSVRSGYGYQRDPSNPADEVHHHHHQAHAFQQVPTQRRMSSGSGQQQPAQADWRESSYPAQDPHGRRRS